MDFKVPKLLPDQVTSALETNASLLRTNAALIESNTALDQRNTVLDRRNVALEERIASLEQLVLNLQRYIQFNAGETPDFPSQRASVIHEACQALYPSEQYYERDNEKPFGIPQRTINNSEDSQEWTMDGTEDTALPNLEYEAESEGQRNTGAILSRSATLDPSTSSASPIPIETSSDATSGRFPGEPSNRLPGLCDRSSKRALAEREAEKPEVPRDSQEFLS